LSDRESPYTPFLRRFTNERATDAAETNVLFNRVTSAFRASVWAQSGVIDQFSDNVADQVGNIVEAPHSQSLCQALDKYQREVLNLETTIFSEARVDFSRPLSLVEETDLKGHLRAQEYFLSHQQRIAKLLASTIGNITVDIIESLPSITDSSFLVPLIALLRNAGDLIDRTIGALCDREAREAGLFAAIRERIFKNICEFSGVPMDGKSSKPLIRARDADLPPDKLIDVYLGGTPLHDLFLTPVPFSLPEEQRFSGHWIVAPPGRGKTTLLHSMFLDDLTRDASIILMDSKGDLIGPIKELAAVKDRLVLIQPDPEFPLALNPLDIPKANINHVVSLLEYIFSALLEAKMTPLQMTLFRTVLPAIVEVIPNATLQTFIDIITNGVGRYHQQFAELPKEERAFFYNGETGFLSKTYVDTRNQLIWRLQFLMTNPIIKQMFSAPKTKLDIGKEMDAGKIILIDNSKKTLGDEGAEFFGRFFIALVLAAAEQRAGRPQTAKRPCFFYIDECHNVIRRDEKISAILDECRSHKIAMILAHQRTAQITSENVLDALANCAIRMANSDDEAKYLADKLRTDTDSLRSLPRGTFAAFIRDVTSNALALKVPYADLSKLPRISAAEQKAIRDRMRVEYSFSPVAQSPEPEAAHPPAISSDHEASPAPTGRDRPRPAATRRDTSRPPPDDTSETGSTW
jgi:hypothetical protein